MCIFRLAGKLDKDGYLILSGPRSQEARGVKLMNMQRLYDPDTAAMLVPAYITSSNDATGVSLTDMRSRSVDLASIADQDWRSELHLLCLSIEPQYRRLWHR